MPREKTRDIPAYNRANARMWFVYGGLFVFTGGFAFFSIGLSGILAGVFAIGGLPVLILTYDRIYKRYKW